MKKSGYDVMIARNGAEALALIESHMPALILLDIMMPDVDGYAICQHVKQTPELAHIIVVFVSAKTQPADLEKGISLGAAAYISKPFSNKEVMQQVAGLLGD